MFILKNKDAKFPPRYEHIERKAPTINDKGWDKVGNFTLRDKVDLIPQEGLQEDLCRCESNLIFICGEATSGKSYGMMLKGLAGVGKEGYTGRLINVRKQDSSKGTSMFRDGMEVWGKFAKCEVTSSESPTFSWPEWNNAIQMIHANFNADNPGEWDDFQEYIKKQQSSYIAIDEATAIEQFKMFAYIFSRNRDSSGVTPSMVLAFNFKHEHWTTPFLVTAGYIGDDWYLKPEMVGKTRYFYIKGNTPDGVIWGNSKKEVVEAANITINESDREAGLTEEDMVKSFTLFTGHASGNRKLVNATKGQSVANLHNVGEAQRKVLAEGYAGPVESEELTVTKQMIRNLFINPEDIEDGEMHASMDISAGGIESDNCPMIIKRGNTIIAIKFFRGTMKELVDWINNNLQEYNIPIENFTFDGTGLGAYLKSFTSGRPVTANARPIQEIDINGNPVTMELYFNLRSQLLGKLKVTLEKGDWRIALDPYTILPYGKNGQTRALIDILYEEIDVFRCTTRNNKFYYHSKDEYKKKHKASPDLMDTLSYMEIFEMDARPRKTASPEVEDDSYTGLYNDYNSRGSGVVWV